jgi:chromosome segregation ATPase
MYANFARVSLTFEALLKQHEVTTASLNDLSSAHAALGSALQAAEAKAAALKTNLAEVSEHNLRIHGALQSSQEELQECKHRKHELQVQLDEQAARTKKLTSQYAALEAKHDKVFKSLQTQFVKSSEAKLREENVRTLTRQLRELSSPDVEQLRALLRGEGVQKPKPVSSLFSRRPPIPHARRPPFDPIHVRR